MIRIDMPLTRVTRVRHCLGPFCGLSRASDAMGPNFNEALTPPQRAQMPNAICKQRVRSLSFRPRLPLLSDCGRTAKHVSFNGRTVSEQCPTFERWGRQAEVCVAAPPKVPGVDRGVPGGTGRASAAGTRQRTAPRAKLPALVSFAGKLAKARNSPRLRGGSSNHATRRPQRPSVCLCGVFQERGVARLNLHISKYSCWFWVLPAMCRRVCNLRRGASSSLLIAGASPSQCLL